MYDINCITDDPSIPGFFNFPGVYDWAVHEAPPGSLLIEIGVFHGRSLIYLAKSAKRAAKGLQVVGVDWGMGYNGPTTDDLLWNLYTRNLEVPIILADSERAAQFFADGSCFFVFIDADHSEEKVRKDILAWRPKVSPGGILAGHDYDLYWGENTQQHCPGVRAAVDEVLGPAAGNLPVPGCWMVRC